MANKGKPFERGDSRINRKGRPKKGQSLAEKFRDAMAESLTGDYTKLDNLIDKLLDKALKGDLPSMQEALSRGYGKLIDRTENVNLNKHHIYSNKSLEERKEALRLLREGTVRGDLPDAD